MAERKGIEQIGVLAAELMQLLEETEMPESNLKATIGVVAVVVEVEVEHDNGLTSNYIHYRCSDPRRWLQAGFFHQAERAVYATSESPR